MVVGRCWSVASTVIIVLVIALPFHISTVHGETTVDLVSENVSVTLAAFAATSSRAFLEEPNKALWGDEAFHTADFDNETFVNRLASPRERWMDTLEQLNLTRFCANTTQTLCNERKSALVVTLNHWYSDSLLQMGKKSPRRARSCTYLASRNQKMRWYSHYSYICMSCNAWSSKRCTNQRSYDKCNRFSVGMVPKCNGPSFGGSGPKKCSNSGKYACYKRIDYWVSDFTGDNSCYNLSEYVRQSSMWLKEPRDATTLNVSVEALYNATSKTKDVAQRCGKNEFVGHGITNPNPTLVVTESNTANSSLFVAVRSPFTVAVGAAIAMPIRHVASAVFEAHQKFNFDSIASRSDPSSGLSCIVFFYGSSGYSLLAESTIWNGRRIGNDTAPSFCDLALATLSPKQPSSGTDTHHYVNEMSKDKVLWANLQQTGVNYTFHDVNSSDIFNATARLTPLDWVSALESIGMDESQLDFPNFFLFSVSAELLHTPSQSWTPTKSFSQRTRTGTASALRSASISWSETETDSETLIGEETNTSTTSAQCSVSHSLSSTLTGSSSQSTPVIPAPEVPNITTAPTNSADGSKKKVTVMTRVFKDEATAQAVTTVGETAGLTVGMMVPSTGAYAIRSSVLLRTFDCSANDANDLERPPYMWFPIQVPLTDGSFRWFVGSAAVSGAVFILFPMISVIAHVVIIFKLQHSSSLNRPRLIENSGKVFTMLFTCCSTFFSPPIAGTAVLAWVHSGSGEAASMMVVVFLGGVVTPLALKFYLVAKVIPGQCDVDSSTGMLKDQAHRAEQGAKYRISPLLEIFVDAVGHCERILRPVWKEKTSSKSSSTSSSSSDKSADETVQQQPKPKESNTTLLLRRCYLVEEDCVSLFIACCGNIRPSTTSGCQATLALMLIAALAHLFYFFCFKPYAHRMEQVPVYACAVLQLFMIFFAVLAMTSSENKETYATAIEVCNLAQFVIFIVQVFVEAGVVYVRYQKRVFVERMKSSRSPERSSSDSEEELATALELPLLNDAPNPPNNTKTKNPLANTRNHKSDT